MTVNTSRGKTEAILAPRGPGSVAVRAGLFSRRRPALPVLTEYGPSCAISLVSSYKHLGGMIASDGSMMVELRARRSKATAAFRSNRKAVFCNRRLYLLRASVLSIYLHGAGTWPLLTSCEFATFSAGLCGFLRPVFLTGRGRDARPSNEEVLAACNFPSCQASLHLARLRHLRTLLVSGPSLLWASVHEDPPMLGAYQEACLWLWSVSGQTACPHPLHQWDDFKALAAGSPHTWKRLLKQAAAISSLELARVASLQCAARTAFAEAQRLLVPLVFQPRPTADACLVCVRCRISFPDLNAWSMHAVSKHGFRAQWTQVATGNTCCACGHRANPDRQRRMHKRLPKLGALPCRRGAVRRYISIFSWSCVRGRLCLCSELFGAPALSAKNFRMVVSSQTRVAVRSCYPRDQSCAQRCILRN